MIKLLIHRTRAVPPAFMAERRELGGITSDPRDDNNMADAVA